MNRLLRRSAIPLVILILGALVIVLAMQFRDLPPVLRRGMQPSWFPIGVAMLIMGLAVMLFWRQDAASEADVAFNRLTLRTFMVVPVCIVLLQADFLLALSLSALFIHLLWARKLHWQPLVLLGIVMPALIYALFGEALAIRFPRGFITNWLYG